MVWDKQAFDKSEEKQLHDGKITQKKEYEC